MPLECYDIVTSADRRYALAYLTALPTRATDSRRVLHCDERKARKEDATHAHSPICDSTNDR